MNREPELPPLLAGVYQHYKGPMYLVLGYGHDANDDDRAVVVYIGLELPGATRKPRIKVRTADDFLAHVDPRTGEAATHWDGTTENMPTARFTYVGPVVPSIPQG